MAYNLALQCVWFRNDLRINDNPALSAAVKTQEPTIAIFVASQEQWQIHHRSAMQIDLVKRRLIALREDLAELNIPLIVLSCPLFSDIPNELAALSKQLGIKQFFANKEYPWDEQQRDLAVASSLQSISVGFKDFDEKCILDVGVILNKTKQPYKVFTPFKKAWRKLFYDFFPKIEKIGPSIQLEQKQYDSVMAYDQPDFCHSATNISDNWPADTQQIIQLMREFCQEKSYLYHQNRDFPATDGTSGISPYLAIGALSAKQCALRLHLEANNQLNQGQEIWLDELIWREFYTHLLHFTPSLARGKAFLSYDKFIPWNNDRSLFEAWCAGKTGYPIIDAAMTQLNQTGWMHNRLRMITASFLVKDLHIDWRWGEQYFMSKLIDGDFASNNGGWQWCASVGCDSSPYFRIFNPTTQGKRFDADSLFIKHWLPQLDGLSNKEIHQTGSINEVNESDYPKQIVEHALQRVKVIDIYKQAKQQDVAT